MDSLNWNTGGAGNSLSKVFLIEHLVIDGNSVHSPAHIPTDKFLGSPSAVLELETLCAEETWALKTNDLYSVSSSNWASSIVLSDFAHSCIGNPGYFMLVTAEQTTFAWIWFGNHKFSRYIESERVLAAILAFCEAEINEYTDSFKHVHIQQSGTVWNGFNALWYYRYVITDNSILKHSLALWAVPH